VLKARKPERAGLDRREPGRQHSMNLAVPTQATPRGKR